MESAVQEPQAPASEALFTPRFWLACAMHFSGGMALSLWILFPLFIRRLGGSEFTIGLYAGLMGAAAVAVRLPVGNLLDTQGRRRVLVAAGGLHVASWLGFLWIDALGPAAALLVVAHGVAGGALFAAYFTYASDITPLRRRSEGIAMFGVWGILPNGLGPLLGERLIASGGGFRAFFLTATALALLSLCLSALLPETTAPAHRQGGGSTRAATPFPFRALLFLLSTTFVFGLAMNGVFTFLAPFADSEGHGGVGSFFMSYSLTAVAVRVLSGRLPDRVGLRPVLIPALFAYAAGICAIPHVWPSNAALLVGVLCGAGHGYAFPILNVLTVERVPAAQRGRAVSWFTAMFDLGTMLGNPLLGAVAEAAGYGAMFTAAGLGMLMTATAVWLRPTARRPPEGG